ncbi:TonB-dependent receptor plug domain-containing protein [Treponema primitia]|uniref:TonB-dependent receptor plug domain-containing protein n=1 Tax=Treponema primitia TaxID=88058 RepID=UPI000C1F96DC|nr:TonB-dependent receptor plug domain-containing protein [Treponema primitia]
MPKIPVLPFALAVLLVFCSAPLFGRDVVVTVSDADLGIPLEGAVIRSWDGREYVCDEDGRAEVTVPDDQQVVIRIAYPGYENGRLLIPVGGNEFFSALRLGGIMENHELVIEASSPEVSEARSGRSIAISGETLSRTAEIGFIEDVMTSIKLLPGVGYSGMFDAQPSIRGGSPGDLMAALDGFYIDDPYHWGGAYSIFVPQMVESATLSHGVFSSRYGHTISGLLEVVTRKPSPTETQFDLGVSTSETNLGLSFPLVGKGGVAAMGKVTYWDPFVWGAQQLSKGVPELEMINSVTTAPYIRDFSITGNYRFSTDLELTATGFFGSDGVGADYHNEYERDGDKRNVDLIFDWMNYRLFGITGITWSPHRDMVFRASAGAGLYETDMIADVTMELPREPGYTPPLPIPSEDGVMEENEEGPVFWDYLGSMNLNGGMTNKTITYQGRADFDWGLREGFIFAAGAQELYSQWIEVENFRRVFDPIAPLPPKSGLDFEPYDMSLDVKNHGLSSSVYSLLEYLGPGQKFGAELGLRVDHFYFIGRNFTIQTIPVLNPRLNLDFGILKNRGSIDALTLTVGTGLFSSMNDVISSIDVSNNIDDFELKPNRSWTSIVGTKIDFTEKFSFNIEAYYKYIFDRAYTVSTTHEDDPDNPTKVDTKIDYWFNGLGRVIGFDFILQRLESRYWDGWLSYSFTWAQYQNPDTIPDADDIPDDVNPERYPKTGNDWFYPSFHRYHNINLVLSFKPSRSFNVGTRFGFASGTPKGEKNDKRTGFSWPVDVKFSFFRFNPKGKVNTEMYLGIENLQALVYDAIWIARVNGYTGEEDPSEYTPVYDLPIPMISFGFKWRY